MKTLAEKYLRRLDGYRDRPLIMSLVSHHTDKKADPLNVHLSSIINILISKRIDTKEQLLALDVNTILKYRGMGKMKIDLLYKLIGEKEPFKNG